MSEGAVVGEIGIETVQLQKAAGGVVRTADDDFAIRRCGEERARLLRLCRSRPLGEKEIRRVVESAS